MKSIINIIHFPLLLTSLCLVTALLSTGCQSSGIDTASLPDQHPVSEVVQEVQDDGQTIIESITEIYVEYSEVSDRISIETIPAVFPNSENPYWEILPDYQVLTLEGYPVSDHLLKPQIFVYPLSELGSFNDGADQIAGNLDQLLKDEMVGEYLPFLPLYNASQVMHAHVEFIEFKNGKGVRFLTQFDQAPIPLNNYELIYTFQGITEDGKYYVAAVFPVTHPDLPVDDRLTFDEEYSVEKFVADMAESIETLENQPGDSFSPDLSVLDAVIRSMEIK